MRVSIVQIASEIKIEKCHLRIFLCQRYWNYWLELSNTASIPINVSETMEILLKIRSRNLN
jgi:hypothetical protein